MFKNIDPRKVKTLFDVLNQYVYVDQGNMTVTINIPCAFITEKYSVGSYYHFVIDENNVIIESSIESE